MEGADMPSLVSVNQVKIKHKPQNYKFIIIGLSSLAIAVYCFAVMIYMFTYSISIWDILLDLQLITSMISPLVIILLGALNNSKFTLAGIALSGIALAYFSLDRLITFLDSGVLIDFSDFEESLIGISYLIYLITQVIILILCILQYKADRRRSL